MLLQSDPDLRWGRFFHAVFSEKIMPCRERIKPVGPVKGPVKIYAQIYLQAPAE